MKYKKLISKITLGTIFSTSIFSFALSDTYAYENIYRKGNQIVRTYTSSSNNFSSVNTYNTYSYTNSKEYISNNETYNKNTSTSKILTKTNDSINKNEKIYIQGSKIIRVYGTTSNSNNIYDKNLSKNDTSSNNNIDNNSLNLINDSLQTKITTSSSSTLTDYQIKSLVYEMLDLINTERKNNGLKPLILDEKLTSVAQLKAKDMAENNYLSHTSPTYGSVYSMIKNADINYYIAGENIAKAYSIKSAHINFMNSWIHRKAILSPNFTHIGIGIDKPQNSNMYKISVMFIEKNRGL
ncbi:CAP domain-containing protein [Caminicella sporogenes]|uniref:CAP domain-containing protein n=1 Tax=Caminicella sporogenes TaxID=166485 RepID=UPI0025401E8F|nr:CAP domain-containing protein [Caminicella sporogenes]WIF94836.1 CAP domain-containing protein [Caminicella sporogenes]